MSDRVSKIEAHDAAGFETEFINWEEEYGDSYGNNVAHSDLSMQRMVERGGRAPWGTTTSGEESYGVATPPEGFDKDPFMSKAQQRYMHAAANRGEIPKATVAEYDRKTDFSHLPERKK